MSGDFKGVKKGDTWYTALVSCGQVVLWEDVVMAASDDILCLARGAGFTAHNSIQGMMARPSRKEAVEARIGSTVERATASESKAELAAQVLAEALAAARLEFGEHISPNAEPLSDDIANSAPFRGAATGDVWFEAFVRDGRLLFLEEVVGLCNDNCMLFRSDLERQEHRVFYGLGHLRLRPTKQAAVQVLLDATEQVRRNNVENVKSYHNDLQALQDALDELVEQEQQNVW